MTFVDQIHQKRMDLRRIVKDMQSISPKTSTYKKLAVEAEKLQIELSKMGAVRTDRSKVSNP